MKILIIKLSSLGDVVHTLPSLYALRSAYPFAKIDWLVEREASDILIDHPLLNEVLVMSKKGWVKDFKGTYSLVKKIRELDYDMVIDFQGLLKSGIWVFLSHGRRRIGFDKSREMSSIFLNERVPAYDPDKHAVDRYLDIVEYLGIKNDKVFFPIPISETAKKKVAGLLKASGIGKEIPFVVVNPMARWKTKLWGGKKFANLCNEMMDRFSHKVVMIGAYPGEESKEIASLTKNRVVDFIGKTTLRELAYLMGLSQMVITVDSGPMHIAAAMGVPVLPIFGPTAPWRTGPYGQLYNVIRMDLPCSPCFYRKCNNLQCMNEIKVEDVMEAVERQIKVKNQWEKGKEYEVK